MVLLDERLEFVGFVGFAGCVGDFVAAVVVVVVPVDVEELLLESLVVRPLLLVVCFLFLLFCFILAVNSVLVGCRSKIHKATFLDLYSKIHL